MQIWQNLKGVRERRNTEIKKLSSGFAFFLCSNFITYILKWKQIQKNSKSENSKALLVKPFKSAAYKNNIIFHNNHSKLKVQ